MLSTTTKTKAKDKVEEPKASVLVAEFELALSPFADQGLPDEQVAELARAMISRHFTIVSWDWHRNDNYKG